MDLDLFVIQKMKLLSGLKATLVQGVNALLSTCNVLKKYFTYVMVKIVNEFIMQFVRNNILNSMNRKM